MCQRLRNCILLIASYMKFVAYRIATMRITKSPSNNSSNKLLIVKLDEIGDYILFRNLLKFIREANKFRDYSITLCGNKAWKEIFDLYDSEFVENTI